jgi:hypothetical protein
MDTLQANGRLELNQTLQSDNGQHTLVMQADGNLVLYDGWPGAPTAIWASNTAWMDPGLRPTYVEMQSDGNFVLYNSNRVPAWDSGTWNHPGSRIVLQNDRNLVLFDPNGPIWASHTGLDLSGTAVVQNKRDEVGYGKFMTTDATLYRNGRIVVDTFCQNGNWTSGLRGKVLVVAVDGRGRAIWVSDVIQCPTCCSVPDFSCSSNRRTNVLEEWPEVVAEYTTRLDIYQADDPNYVDLRQKFIDGIKALGDIADALKQQIVRVYGG